MKKLILLATIAVIGQSYAKGYIQDWTPKLPAWQSTVFSCDAPKPYKIIAADDFIFDFTLPIAHINWWGVVSDPKQLMRPYYIAIYKDNGLCMPAWDSVVYSECVKPTDFTSVGVDCQGNKVWKLFSNVTPFTLGPGHYWIQISEDDLDSYQPDVPDFWWSSHEPVVKCPALQMDYLGNIFQPLIDPCTQREDDLAFEILA